MKELEDHNFFPSVLRNYQTEFIGFLVARFNVYDGFVQHIKTLSLPALPVNDLCSGSGEPAVSIFKKSDCFTSLTLSDKYPNPSHYGHERIIYETQKRDVLEMEFKPGNYYTMFNALHHFDDADKLKTVKKIQASASTAFFVEILDPGIASFLKVVFASTIGALLLTPFVKPFSIKRLLLTYILPVNLFTIAFDGVVSVFKSRSLKHYRKLFGGFEDSIKIIRLKNSLAPLIVIQIQPRK